MSLTDATVSATFRGTPAMTVAWPFARFLRYARATFQSLLAEAAFFRGSERIEIDALRPRSLLTSGEAIPLASSLGRATSMIGAHLDALLDLTCPESGDVALAEASWKVDLADLRAQGRWRLPEPQPGGPEQDYVFRFPLPEAEAPRSSAEYCAVVTRAYLDYFELLSGGRPVEPTAVRAGIEVVAVPRSAPWDSLDLGPRAESDRHPLHGVASSTPAIVVLARHWAALHRTLKIDSGEESRRLDGFRLLRSSDWIAESTGHPADVYQYLSRVCNVACSFCYLFGNPEGLAVARGKKTISRSEIETRLRHFDRSARRRSSGPNGR